MSCPASGRAPPKATFQRFEASPDLEFDYLLAEKLGMLVADLRERMTGDEYLGWTVYFQRKAQRAELAAKKAG
jgi:hypothetical protein